MLLGMGYKECGEVCVAGHVHMEMALRCATFCVDLLHCSRYPCDTPVIPLWLSLGMRGVSQGVSKGYHRVIKGLSQGYHRVITGGVPRAFL